MRGGRAALISLLIVAACGDDAPGSAHPAVDTSTDTTPAATTPTVADEPASATTPAPNGQSTSPAPPNASTDTGSAIDVPEAAAINVATNGASAPAIAWNSVDATFVARLDVESHLLAEPVPVSGDRAPVAHAIERPAVAVGDDGVVRVAFTSFEDSSGSVWYAEVDDGRPGLRPVRISGDTRPETNLVHMTTDGDPPWLAWLEDSTLSVAPPDADTPVEIEEVDGLTCDCCNPVPVRVDGGAVVAYRNLERTDDEVIRDVYAVATSDEGASFTDPVKIADEHWFLDSCPFSGPSIIDAGNALVVAWSDGRQTRHPDQDGLTIWVDRSTDGAATFDTDIAITDGGIHRWPVLAIDATGTIHLVWETQSPGDDGGLSYTHSTDGGLTFAAPRLLLPNTDTSGQRKSPSVAVHDDRLIVTWVDRTGGHIMQFGLADLAS